MDSQRRAGGWNELQQHQHTFLQLSPEGGQSHYQQGNCRREATIGILCRQTAGSAGRRNTVSPQWRGGRQTQGTAFGSSSRGTLQSDNTLLSVVDSSRNKGKAFMHFLLVLVAVFGCCFTWTMLWEKPTGFGSVQQILACQQGCTRLNALYLCRSALELC